MKLGALILLMIPITTAFPGVSSAQIWLASFQQPLKNLIDNPFRRSTVPQFILDAGHAWILDNQRRLESLPNAEAFLCSDPDSESTASSGTETATWGSELEVPPDLFDKLEIINSRPGNLRPGWPNALERITEMKRCQRALNQVKTLEVQIYVHRGTYSDLYLKILEPSQPPEQLLTSFGDVLESMTNLETLKWGIPKEHNYLFEKSFKSRNLTLASIKNLEPGSSGDYLVSMCPNLEWLENVGGYAPYHGYMPDGRDWGMTLIQATVSTPKLNRFSTKGGPSGWSPPLVSEVVKFMPQLRSLGLLGSLGREMGYTGLNTGDSGRLKAVLDVLTGLKNLTHLDLPASWSLGLGFNGGSGCGNVYFGKEGRIYAREVTKEGAEATEQGGDIVVANLPNLTSFTIGSFNANITRTQGKMANATWPWTGRMDDWLMEMVPEKPDFEDIEYGSM